MEEASPKIFIPNTIQGVSEHVTGQIELLWELVKVPLIVPLLKLGVYICLAMSLMLFMERLYMGIVIILVKLFWKNPNSVTTTSPSKTTSNWAPSSSPRS